MKKQLGPLLIVEGKADKAYISSFFDADIVLTNGYDIRQGDILFLKELQKQRPLILLTDSDPAGETIRNKINSVIPDLINVRVDISLCDRHHKHGVAEADKEELIRLLSPYQSKEVIKGKLSLSDIYPYLKYKEEIASTFHLGEVHNTKQFLERINLLNISTQDIANRLK